MIHIILTLLILLTLSVQAETIICIDGGGSKTLLQAIDQQGKILSLVKNGIVSDRIISGGSNINTVGRQGVKEALDSLFADTYIDKQKLTDILPECIVYACFAGIGTTENKGQVAAIMQEAGVNPNKMKLLTDAEMALQLIKGDGAILICGTGSICLGKKAGVKYCVGGLGRIIGDEGSGYQIGLQAIKAAMADEYGWGEKTALTNALKEHFAVAELKQLVRPINSGEMLPGKIATAAALVFEQAFDYEDPIAQGIIEQAEKDLSGILEKLVEKSDLSNCEIHLWGGVFKSHYADHLIQALTEKVAARKVTIVNQSHQNVALLYANLAFNLQL